jgi:hypothetical protein
MTENMGKRPCQVACRTQEDRKSGHRMAPEIIFFPRTGYGGMILTNLKVIWEVSASRMNYYFIRTWSPKRTP